VSVLVQVLVLESVPALVPGLELEQVLQNHHHHNLALE
jgi:hypothetical protein